MNRPGDNNFVLTGLPRSGTTLTCSLLNRCENVVALHEPMRPGAISGTIAERLESIKSFYAAQRHSILTEGRAVSKSENGKVPTNSLTDDWVEGSRRKTINGNLIDVENVSRSDFRLFIKHPAMFTALLPELLREFECFATVRNPLAVLLSWRDSGMGVARGRLPVAESLDADLRDALDREPDVTGRQIRLLDYFCTRYATYIPGNVLRYEDIVATGGAALTRLVGGEAALAVPLESRNSRAVEGAEAASLADRLLADHDNGCWRFYDRESVAALTNPAAPLSR